MYLIIEKTAWGFEARIRGKANDDIAAGNAPTMATAIGALRFAVLGLPRDCRVKALALINNA